MGWMDGIDGCRVLHILTVGEWAPKRSLYSVVVYVLSRKLAQMRMHII